ncbi:amino acid permease [Fodinicola feengrottensis]|uniref:Amino acid permease n=1 Tax=Fodinicola feengrottensis TaxID=435914 RepID=A0ABN2J4S0_9ACTN
MNLLRTKTIEQSIADTDEPDTKLRKSLSALDLTVFGVAVMIGAGIFILTGRAAATTSGPAIVISFVLAAIACGFAGLCYAEFASTVPVAGSAYTYSYATLGEFVAWIIGWDLALELALGAATVAKGWSSYLLNTLQGFGIPVPTWFAGSDAKVDFGAFILVAALTALLAVGTKLSSRVSLVITSIKVVVVLLVIVAGVFYINGANYVPFVPPAQAASAGGGGLLDSTLIQAVFGGIGTSYGLFGIFAGASLVFFAFIGFDVVATAAEETRNPQRDVPRGILGSLVICTILYCAVSMVITGMQKYSQINPKSAAPLADAFKAHGVQWTSQIISFGALCGLTTVVMVLLLGQSRVLFAMSRDNLLPRAFGKTNRKTNTPVYITVTTGAVVALLAAFVQIGALEEMVNIGTLFAFILVSAGVWVLRRKRPDLPRKFKVKAVPVVATLAIVFCVWLMLNLSVVTWLRFIIWMVIGLGFYFAYGAWKSRLAVEEKKARQQN